MDVNEVTDEDYALVNVAALDDTTFTITLPIGEKASQEKVA
jgi:hypothetical protein